MKTLEEQVFRKLLADQAKETALIVLDFEKMTKTMIEGIEIEGKLHDGRVIRISINEADDA